jgi:hypothetical protein
MPLANPVDLAERVKELLNVSSGQPFPDVGTLPTIVATRTYMPRFELKQLADFTVTVVPRVDDLERGAKGSFWTHELSLDVGLQKLLDPALEEVAQIDGLLLDTETILRFLQARAILRAYVAAVAWDPLYDEDSLEQHGCFTSVLRMTYRFSS